MIVLTPKEQAQRDHLERVVAGHPRKERDQNWIDDFSAPYSGETIAAPKPIAQPGAAQAA